MFIFVLQTIWLYIGELAGKDLDAGIIGRFLLYFSPKLIPLVLPLIHTPYLHYGVWEFCREL
jgi:lipopolysaccharide export system permease protein